MSEKHHAREEKDERTRLTAENNGQLWDTTDDQIVLDRGMPVPGPEASFVMQSMDDEEIAVLIGRTFSAVRQRRSVLYKLMQQGLTLEEIHVAEKQVREQRNRSLYRKAEKDISSLFVCHECFCIPHAPGCSHEGEA